MHYKRKTRALIIPGLAGFLLFYIIPFAWSFQYAFTNNPLQLRFVGLRNFAASFQNPYYMMALRNTLVFTVFGVSLIVLFSTFVSLLVSSAGKRYRFLRIAFILPILLPTAGSALIWRAWFNPDGRLATLLPVYLIFIWKYCGFNIVITVAAIAGISREISEAAALDGAGGCLLHIRITLPMIRSTLFFVAILSVVNSFRIYKEMYYLFGTNYPPDPAYLMQYYMNNSFEKLNYQALSSGALIFAAIVFVVVFFGYRSDLRKGYAS